MNKTKQIKMHPLILAKREATQMGRCFFFSYFHSFIKNVISNLWTETNVLKWFSNLQV